MEFKTAFAVLAIFITSAVTVDALKCFMCDAVNSGSCFGPDLNEVTIVLCQNTLETPSACFKLSGTIANSTTQRVTRGCIIQNLADSLCTAATVDIDGECVTCNEDLCNY